MKDWKPPHHWVSSFLAKRGMCRNIWGLRMEDGLIRYVAKDEDATNLDLGKYKKRLPLVVPGLSVVRTEMVKGTRGYGRSKAAVLWCDWSYEACKARYREVVEEFGIADPRLAYMKCGGKREGTFQLTLDGMPEPEPQFRGGGGVFAGWTAYGLAAMDGGFANRIRNPNLGGIDFIPFDQTVEYGPDWWLVGSRGDSYEIMEIEILASPLDARTKENLIHNLGNYRKGEAA